MSTPLIHTRRPTMTINRLFINHLHVRYLPLNERSRRPRPYIRGAFHPTNIGNPTTNVGTRAPSNRNLIINLLKALNLSGSNLYTLLINKRDNRRAYTGTNTTMNKRSKRVIRLTRFTTREPRRRRVKRRHLPLRRTPYINRINNFTIRGRTRKFRLTKQRVTIRLIRVRPHRLINNRFLPHGNLKLRVGAPFQWGCHQTEHNNPFPTVFRGLFTWRGDFFIATTYTKRHARPTRHP